MIALLLALLISTAACNDENLVRMKKDFTMKEISSSNSLCRTYNTLLIEAKSDEEVLRCINNGTNEEVLITKTTKLNNDLNEAQDFINKKTNEIDNYTVGIIFESTN